MEFEVSETELEPLRGELGAGGRGTSALPMTAPCPTAFAACLSRSCGSNGTKSVLSGECHLLPRTMRLQ